MFKIVLQRDAALGNGTRLRGLVLGVVSGLEPADLVELAQATPGKSLRDLSLPEGSVVSLAGDVEACELLTAIRNGDLVAYVDNKAIADFAELDGDPDDMGEFPEAGVPTVPQPAKRTTRKTAKSKRAQDAPAIHDDPTAGRR